MKQRIKNILIGYINIVVVICMFMAFAGCRNVPTNYIDLPDVTVGETFEIVLTTGNQYEWECKSYSQDGIEFVGVEPIPHDPEQIGSWSRKFIFKAIKAGSHIIKFEHLVVWNNDPPNEQNIYTIHIFN